LVHRDIKPDNILIANKTLKISDFGLSKIVTEGTRTSTFKGIGCIPYLAPEGWRFEKNTILMDIYSMGIVFYELSTLQHPLTASNRDLRSWQDAHLFQTPDRPDVINRDLSPTFSHLIMKMIEKKPNMRFQNWQAVREMLKSESFPRTPDSELVESVLRKRIEIDQKERDEETKKLKMDREIEELKKLVQFQLQNEVINPLKTFVEEINAKYSGAKNRIASSRDGFTYTLTTSAHKSLTFVVKPIIEKEFYRERVSNDYGRKTERTELQIPTYNGKQLLAWGYIKAEDGRGMNLLLLKEQQQPYGSWYLLTNKTSAFTDRQRPTPFPFEFDEIEKELQLVKAMHIYVSQGEPLNIGKLKEFVTEYI
jgi:serine/threonine protein kinase